MTNQSSFIQGPSQTWERFSVLFLLFCCSYVTFRIELVYTAEENIFRLFWLCPSCECAYNQFTDTDDDSVSIKNSATVQEML